MRRNIGITVLTAAMLLSGLLVGNAYGGSDEITEPRVIELIHGDVSAADYPHPRHAGQAERDHQPVQGAAP